MQCVNDLIPSMGNPPCVPNMFSKKDQLSLNDGENFAHGNEKPFINARKRI